MIHWQILIHLGHFNVLLSICKNIEDNQMEGFTLGCVCFTYWVDRDRVCKYTAESDWQWIHRNRFTFPSWFLWRENILCVTEWSISSALQREAPRRKLCHYKLLAVINNVTEGDKHDGLLWRDICKLATFQCPSNNNKNSNNKISH